METGNVPDWSKNFLFSLYRYKWSIVKKRTKNDGNNGNIVLKIYLHSLIVVVHLSKKLKNKKLNK